MFCLYDAERKKCSLLETNAERFQHFRLSFRTHQKYGKRSNKNRDRESQFDESHLFSLLLSQL